jgi:hypothetical protein
MTATILRWSLASCLSLVLAVGSVAFAAELQDGPVKRGTRVEELKAERGEPVNVVPSQGEGVPVERWYYPEKLVVVVQDGFVIDSFVEK